MRASVSANKKLDGRRKGFQLALEVGMFSCLKRFLQLAQRYTYDYRKLLYDDKAHFLGTVRTPPERVIGEAARAFLWLVERLPQIVGAMLIWQDLSEDLSSDHAADERECKMSRAASSSPGRKLHLCINVTELGKIGQAARDGATGRCCVLEATRKPGI